MVAVSAAAEAREILKPTKYHGKSFQSLIVFHEILKTAPRRSHAIHFRYGSKSGSCRCRLPPCDRAVCRGISNVVEFYIQMYILNESYHR